MTHRKCIVHLLAVALTGLFVSATGASAQCLSGTIDSELQIGGPYHGLYKYTIQFTWNSPQGLSNATLDCNWECDPLFACQQTFFFDSPAGYSDGVPDSCLAEYSGEFNCAGNPSIGLDEPVVKWDAIDTGSCEPGTTGSATLSFYTNIPPQSGSVPIVLEKNGQNLCQGILVGHCPELCTVPVEDQSWGSVKFLFH